MSQIAKAELPIKMLLDHLMNNHVLPSNASNNILLDPLLEDIAAHQHGAADAPAQASLPTAAAMLDRSHEQRIRAQQLSCSTEITLARANNEQLAAHIDIDEQIKPLQWPVLRCLLVIDPASGRLGAARTGAAGDVAALTSLVEELNSSPTFLERMKHLYQNLAPEQTLELRYSMGASMDAQYRHLQSRFKVKQALVWKDGDHAARRRDQVLAAASEHSPSIGAEEDFVVLDLNGVSVFSAALAGMRQQGALWDEKTGHDDYARLASVIPDISVHATADDIWLDALGEAIRLELAEPSHADFRASQALIHARYQAGRIEHSWGALGGSMIGGAVYSLGMMMLNNVINRSMIPAEVRRESGLDRQTTAQKLFSDVSEDLLSVATPWQKFLMTFDPSWQLGSWEIFDNAILDAVLGDDDSDDEPSLQAVATDATDQISVQAGENAGAEAGTVLLAGALVASQEKIGQGLAELTAANLKSGLSTVAAKASAMMGQMVSSASFAVPAGIISGVFSWPDKAIEIWKPAGAVGAFKAGFKVAVTSPVSSLACSSGFFLKMGEVAAETEAAVLQALEQRQLAWPQHNPFDATQAFDRSDMEQVKRAVWDMTQEQLNNEPDALAVRLSVPMEFLSGVVQGGISLIPGMNQAISFALDTVFFGPGELLWMTITGAISNRANEQELRTRLAEVMQSCSQDNPGAVRSRRMAVQFLLDNRLISEEGLRQWQQQTVSMLGGAMIHPVYEGGSHLRNGGRVGLRALADLPSRIGATMPDAVRHLASRTGELLSTAGQYVGASAGTAVEWAVSAGMAVARPSISYLRGEEHAPDTQTATRYTEMLRALPAQASKTMTDLLGPAENNLRIRARLPYERAVLGKPSDDAATSVTPDLEHGER
ncbi:MULTISPECIES: hypothetical protein [Herbaspirillum]|uniref:Uncharacterized protein n=1 Tax=Herbaspirillum huttiense subsp. lycopersici TaxID=3074428 RepID=A0ABU2EUX7_9BURK|nr:hypothetical protein [Herbaspirillum huttiense]MBP1313370.1 hypothetical protein [Herbaspirillum sp. 1130]MDR9851972.1 hypothetical protein [Herbaspirillum huttiense SE1]UWE19006.1 hypothetical protein NY669_12750 [Herbaspirillum huttiense]